MSGGGDGRAGEVCQVSHKLVLTLQLCSASRHAALRAPFRELWPRSGPNHPLNANFPLDPLCSSSSYHAWSGISFLSLRPIDQRFVRYPSPPRHLATSRLGHFAASSPRRLPPRNLANSPPRISNNDQACTQSLCPSGNSTQSACSSCVLHTMFRISDRNFEFLAEGFTCGIMFMACGVAPPVKLILWREKIPSHWRKMSGRCL